MRRIHLRPSTGSWQPSSAAPAKSATAAAHWHGIPIDTAAIWDGPFYDRTEGLRPAGRRQIIDNPCPPAAAGVIGSAHDPAGTGRASAGLVARYSCTSRTAVAPSPTAEATRLMDP